MKKKTICCRDFCVIMMTKQVVEFSTNPLNDDVLFSIFVDCKTTQSIMERICAKFHSLSLRRQSLCMWEDPLFEDPTA